jgi:hypothetical protein
LRALSGGAPDAFEIAFTVHCVSLALGAPQRFTEAFHECVLGLVYVEPLAQGVIGGADARLRE